jgi:nucleoside-diphosphate-sugar epimerase
MINKINVFGGNGFIGQRFCEMYKDSILKNEKYDYQPKSNNILYLISTIDNYNIHNNLHIDIDTNLKVLMNVLDHTKNNSDTIFNFVSSWFVYGQNTKIPFKEDDLACNPTGFYSITKRCAEQLIISFCNTFDIKYRIFRLANVLGEGDNKISKKKNALQFLIKEIVENNDVELYYGGNVLRDYIYVDDVCEAIHHCINKAPVNEIINVGSGKPYLFLNIIKKAIDISNSKSNIVEIKPTHFHNIVQVKNSYLDTTKLKNYGYSCKYDIDKIVKKLINHYKK